MRKESVGLIIYAFFDGKLHAVLQRRGTFNVEKMCKESLPGLCQVTVHGGLERDETMKIALKREMSQEISISRIPFTSLTQLRHEKNEKMETITYGYVFQKGLKILLESIRLHSGTGGVEIVTLEEIPSIKVLSNPVSDQEKLKGITDGSITMFTDERDALEEGFLKLIRL
jgi:ADP-ribose pyrophosphatase YjhB (NUDIX family)